ncbi:UTP23 protein, partial [Rhodinocichla rosea]|nr:UTP23 protein [Rhodinocichla rosea]
MGVTRQKHAKKIMGFYKHNFQFREPFQVLLDGTFCQAALRNKIQIREQLPGYLDGAAQLCTTRYGGEQRRPGGGGLRVTCRRLGASSDPAALPKAARTAGPAVAPLCEGGPGGSLPTRSDQELSNKVKRKPGIPLLFIIQNTMVLDKPSPKSLAFVQKLQTNQLVPEYQKQSIVELKEKEGLVKQEGEKRRKRKRAGGPNPLSCLKKKKKKTQEGQEPSAEKKKRRKRKRNR